MVDKHKKGPGVIRNELLKQVTSKYVVFLDADDYLEPTFIERCLEHNDPESYVYTNWMEGETEKSTAPTDFWNNARHLVTCLIHTDMMRIVGGFDETLAAMEDTELFLNFDQYNYCGILVPEPLVHYTAQGQRSRYGRESGVNVQIKRDLGSKYRLGCCNNPNKTKYPPAGTKMENDVLVMALWNGNKRFSGPVTGRPYPRVARPKKLWMDIRDARARPKDFRILPPKDKPKKVNRRQAPVKLKRPRTFADMIHASGMLDYRDENPVFVPSLVAAEIKPDYEKVNEIAQRIYNAKAKKAHRKPGQDIGADSQTVRA
jgi:hypothetical protein